MKKIIFMLGLMFLSHFSYAQITTTKITKKKRKHPDPFKFIPVEKEPEPVNIDDIKQKIGYPGPATKAGIEGIVVMRVLVNKRGKYVKHIVLSSPHPILTEAVEKQLHKLKFTPAIQSGKRVKVWTNIPFRFSLVSETKNTKSNENE